SAPDPSGAKHRGHRPGARETAPLGEAAAALPQRGQTAVAASRMLADSSRRYSASCALIMRSVRRIHLLICLLTSWHVRLVLLTCSVGADMRAAGDPIRTHRVLVVPSSADARLLQRTRRPCRLGICR